MARRALWITAVWLSTATLASADAARDQAWREDLQTFVTQLRLQHPRPFARVAEARFDSAVTALQSRIPQLTDPQMAVELMRIDAMIQDGQATSRRRRWMSKPALELCKTGLGTVFIG